MALINRFLLDSNECELLLEFESVTSVSELAAKLGKDHSVLARTLRQISEKYPVVEKRAGKWMLTDQGRALNEVTRLSLDRQFTALSKQKTLRIGTNREFASRVLCVDFEKIQKIFPGTLLHFISCQEGVESALLKSQIDIGIDCERPMDPEVAYKLIADEEILAVASPAFLAKHRKEIAKSGYQSLPHLLCDRLQPERIFGLSNSRTHVLAKFNDIAATRATCVQGAGWALLPKYTVREELKQGLLSKIDDQLFGKSKYGVWWLRNRPYLKDSVEKVGQWLRKQDL